jgi:hypothetical protein
MTSVPALASTRRPIPEHAGERLDVIAAAVSVLAGERRRFARLGFTGGETRCDDALRFWRFVEALHHVAAHGCRPRFPEGRHGSR